MHKYDNNNIYTKMKRDDIARVYFDLLQLSGQNIRNSRAALRVAINWIVQEGNLDALRANLFSS